MQKGLEMVWHGLDLAAYWKILAGDFAAPTRRHVRKVQTTAGGLELDVEQDKHEVSGHARRERRAGREQDDAMAPAEVAEDPIEAEVSLGDALADRGEDAHNDTDDSEGAASMADVVPASGSVGQVEAGTALEEASSSTSSSDSSSSAASDAESPNAASVAEGALAVRRAPQEVVEHFDSFIDVCVFGPELQARCFGVFLLTRKEDRAGNGWGGLQATCPFHRKNASSGCRKFVSFPSTNVEECTAVLRQLFTWCCRAPRHNRQRDHLWDMPLIEDTPSPEVLRSLAITDGPTEPAKTDDQLDSEDRLRAQGMDREAAAAQVAAGVGGQALASSGKGRARSRGRGRGGNVGRAGARGRNAGSGAVEVAESASSSSGDSSSSSGSDTDSDDSS